jgi:hypothetical protein
MAGVVGVVATLNGALRLSVSTLTPPHAAVSSMLAALIAI